MDEFLQDPTGDIGKIRELGITDFAIVTYLVRVQEGKSQERAFRALVQGRSLTESQLKVVRAVLRRYQNSQAAGSSRAGEIG